MAGETQFNISCSANSCSCSHQAFEASAKAKEIWGAGEEFDPHAEGTKLPRKFVHMTHMMLPGHNV